MKSDSAKSVSKRFNPLSMNKNDKGYRADASQFFVAGELCRRGLIAVVTLGNCPNTDILCSNREGTRFVHIQVKTFIPGYKTCTIGRKGERDYGANFFWVLGGIPEPGTNSIFEYYIVPSVVMAAGLAEDFRVWRTTLGPIKAQRDVNSTMRNLALPPGTGPSGFCVARYKNNWSLIEEQLNG